MVQNHSFLTLADELKGIFDGLFQFYKKMETGAYCVKYEECHPPP